MFTLDKSDHVAVVAAATEIQLEMEAGRQYRITSSTDCYIRITSAGGTAATVGDGSHLLLAGQQALVGALPPNRNRVSIIRVTADGIATLSEIAAMPGG